MYKIMIIEDEANIRIELKTILENALYNVVLVDKFENVVKQIIDENPDIILLDVNLPNRSGLDICMDLRKITENKNVLTHKGVTLDVLNATVKYNDDYIELSKTEMKILYYLFLNKDKIVDRISLVEYLWDNQSFIDDNTLSVNITRIRNKLSEIGVENFIETKRGLGYKIWDL